jgi:hypothetical protein
MQKLTLLLLLIIFFSCKLTTDCSKYHKGTFLYKSRDYFDTLLIERNDSMETTIHMKKGFVTKYRLVWKSPCDYDRYLVSSTDTSESVAYTRNHQIHISILRGWNDYYLFRVTLDEDKIGFVDTVYLAK